MKVTVTRRGGDPVDITHRINERATLRITNERERVDFERIVEDASISASDLDGTFTQMFRGVYGSTLFQLVVEDDRVIFRGNLLNRSLSVDVDNKMVTIPAYATFKEVMNRARSSRVNIPPEHFPRFDPDGPVTYVSVKRILERNFPHEQYGDLFGAIDCLDDIGDALIRFWATTTDTAIGNNGRYRDLSKTTTVAELLAAILLWHNAEAYVDIDTNNLTISRRRDLLSSVVHDIDAIMRDDAKIELLPYGAKKYDYLYAVYKILRPEPAQLVRMNHVLIHDLGFDGSPNHGDIGVQFTVTYLIVAYSGRVVSSPSIGTDVAVPPTDNGRGFPRSDIYYPTIRIPAPPAGTDTVKVYRNYWGDEGIFEIRSFDVASAPAEADGSYVFDDLDTRNYDENGQPIKLETNNYPISLAAWFSYDEETGTWNEPIVDYGGSNAPAGTVLSAVPVLRFAGQDSRDLPYDVFDIFAFFGREGDIRNSFLGLREKWQRVLKTFPLLRVPAKGINYRVGDGGSTQRFPNKMSDLSAGLVLKKAEIDVLKKESNLEFLLL